MAKRFIDTELFNDPWFMDLSKDGKIFWVYLITRCDHAGLLEFNEKLCKFQAGITDIERVIKELGNRLVRVNEQYFFIPKFFKYQYPNFPEKSFKAAESAFSRLNELGIDEQLLNTYLRVGKELPNSYGISIGNGIGNNGEKKDFYNEEIQAHENCEKIEPYKTYVEFLKGKNPVKRKLTKLLNMSDQISYDQFVSLLDKCKAHNKKLTEITLDLDNYTKKTYKSLFRTLDKWSTNEIY